VILPMARAMRPKTFSDLHGHQEIVTALKSILVPTLKHQTFLFSGPKGIGKTTFARLIGQTLLCPNRSENNDPCGSCDICQAIQNGQYSDFLEIDAASKTKVEDVRDLVSSSFSAPLQGAYKVYLFDEAHMLSTHSFNALLKAFEEPPAHVIYILATTDRHKILPTVRSRCLSFTLKPPCDADLEAYLLSICAAQSINYDIAIIKALVQNSDQSYRDLLNLTQHALVLGQGALQGELLQNVFSAISNTLWDRLWTAVVASDLKNIQDCVRKSLQQVGPEQFTKQLLLSLAENHILSVEDRAILYISLSEIPRLMSAHPDPSVLVEMQLVVATLTLAEKKNENLS